MFRLEDSVTVSVLGHLLSTLAHSYNRVMTPPVISNLNLAIADSISFWTNQEQFCRPIRSQFHILKNFKSSRSRINKLFAKIGEKHEISFEQLVWAQSAVRTRTFQGETFNRFHFSHPVNWFTLGDSLNFKRPPWLISSNSKDLNLTMVPLMDMINHSSFDFNAAYAFGKNQFSKPVFI